MLRLPVAGLGLYMVWCGFFPAYAIKLGLTGWMTKLSAAQAIGGAMIWMAAVLDPDRPGPLVATEPGDDESSEGMKFSSLFGSSPVGWAVLACGFFICPFAAGQTHIDAFGFLGLSWVILYIAVTMASSSKSDA